ncbi:UvrD-helicase domain-containing protein [Streptomyces sp. enrichment culture]|uniref:UvrD-helicase domain-containing protein n=1 Tax=Streptomyces sp. enrichment culture TaxID=1795815 RepID=UPI003F555042
MNDLPGSVLLTPAQKSVVTLPWDARTLVTAGAGTGKTTTLTHRLEYLTGVEELEAAEILVLSFSRAAVRELRQRLDRDAVSARRVRAHTFDGWALALLLEADPQRDDLAGVGFDERIRMATDAVERGVVEASEHGVPAHVIIDEVQDLVGVRREMVEAVLDRFADHCGFTVVGDAAQSIYGFQVSTPEERADETNRFFDWVRGSFGDELTEVVLRDNFRARTPEARMALGYGARLQSLPSDAAKAAAEAEAVFDELRHALADAPDFGTLDDPFVQDSLRGFDGTTAVLCRDNGQVLLLSEQLHKHGVPHRVQRSPRERSAPAWVARVLSDTTTATLVEDRFREVLAALGAQPDTEPTLLWRSLRRVAPAARGRLDLDALRHAVAGRRLPDELTAPASHPLTLSTVHRSKGLEFDRVLVVEPRALFEQASRDDDPPSEARLLYVAMTRARDDIYRLAAPATWMMRKADRLHLPVARWYVGGRERYVRAGMEATESDVCQEMPPGAGEAATDPVATQRYLADAVHEGAGVELRRLHDLPASPTQTPPYGIFHEDRLVGEASQSFRGDLWRLLKQHRNFTVEQWPCRITGLRVDAVETVAGHASLTARLGMGDHGVWLAPRLCGLGRFDWTHAKSVLEGHLHS